jgi:hypothetical protein
MAKKTKETREGSGKTITKAIAARWTKDSDSVDLAAFQQLDEDAAKLLATRDLPPLNGTASRERIWGWSKPREATNATRKEGTG